MKKVILSGPVTLGTFARVLLIHPDLMTTRDLPLPTVFALKAFTARWVLPLPNLAQVIRSLHTQARCQWMNASLVLLAIFVLMTALLIYVPEVNIVKTVLLIIAQPELTIPTSKEYICQNVSSVLPVMIVISKLLKLKIQRFTASRGIIA